MTKLFWGSTLVAVGFGAATLFGPPATDATNYRPTVSSHDDVPIAGPTNGDESRPHRAQGELRLRADSEATSLTPVGQVAPTVAPDPADDRQSTPSNWRIREQAPQWLTPAGKVEPTSYVVSDAASEDKASEFGFAASELENSDPQQRPDIDQASFWPEQATIATLTDDDPGQSAARAPNEARRTASDWDHPVATSQRPSGPRPAYQTSSWFDRSPTSTASAELSPGSSPAPHDDDTERAADIATSHEPGEDPQEKVHIVVDGDSLPRLAGRYLDDPERSWEIFQLNRDVLRSPDLLPIGAVLKLPPKQQPTQEPAEQSVLSSSSSPPAGSKSAPARRGRITLPPVTVSKAKMVPVGPVAAEAKHVPQARLLEPVPVDQHQRYRTPSRENGNQLRGTSYSFHSQ